MENNLSKKEKREIKRQERAEDLEKDRRKRAARKALGWVVVLGLIAVAVFAIISRDSSINEIVDIGDLKASDHIKGDKDASVVLIEYSDFQCPACAVYSGLMAAVVEEVGDSFAFVYRHYPLERLHSNAKAAARASEAAAKQDKFWEMHDILFANQSVWAKEDDPKAVFVGIAEQIGLNVVSFEEDYESEEVIRIIDEGLNEALDAGFNSTPTFVINGEKIGNFNIPRDVEGFIELINEHTKGDNS